MHRDRGVFEIELPGLAPVAWRLLEMPQAEQLELWVRFQERHPDA